MNEKEQIADLIKRVAAAAGYERAAVCGADCLLQWNDGYLTETIAAWDSYIEEIQYNRGHNESLRHGAYVPAIPLS